MTTVLTLNRDGSFQEVQPITVSSGTTNAGDLVQLNEFGQLDPSLLPPINTTTSSVTFSVGNIYITDLMSIVLIDSPVTCSAFLPTGTTNTAFTIKNAGLATVDIFPHAIDTIEKTTSFSLFPNNSITIVYFSGNWYVL